MKTFNQFLIEQIDQSNRADSIIEKLYKDDPAKTVQHLNKIVAKLQRSKFRPFTTVGIQYIKHVNNNIAFVDIYDQYREYSDIDDMLETEYSDVEQYVPINRDDYIDRYNKAKANTKFIDRAVKLSNGHIIYNRDRHSLSNRKFKQQFADAVIDYFDKSAEHLDEQYDDQSKFVSTFVRNAKGKLIDIDAVNRAYRAVANKLDVNPVKFTRESVRFVSSLNPKTVANIITMLSSTVEYNTIERGVRELSDLFDDLFEDIEHADRNIRTAVKTFYKNDVPGNIQSEDILPIVKLLKRNVPITLSGSVGTMMITSGDHIIVVFEQGTIYDEEADSVVELFIETFNE